MMLKTKVDIHVFSTVEKNIFLTIKLSLENIISGIEPNVSNKQQNIGVNPYIGYDLYEIICNIIIASKMPYFPLAYTIACTYIRQ